MARARSQMMRGRMLVKRESLGERRQVQLTRAVVMMVRRERTVARRS